MADTEFDIREIIDELTDNIESMIENSVQDAVEDSVTCAVQDALEEALSEEMADLEFTLKDGTTVTSKKHMRLLSPDKSKLLVCYGGLKADGCCLLVQTRISCWEDIAVYPTHEETVEALGKVKKAMDEGLDSFEL